MYLDIVWILRKNIVVVTESLIPVAHLVEGIGFVVLSLDICGPSLEDLVLSED